MAFNLFKKKYQPKAPTKKAAQTDEVQAVQAPSLAAPVNASVLKHFYVSEKSARGQAVNQYTFMVAHKATKSDVKHAVQKAYKVSVTSVNMVRLPAKKRRIGRYMGTAPAIKKAIVSLKEGQVIAQAQP